MNPLRILIPTDFSQQSEYAYELAILFSSVFDIELHVLHVVQSGNDLNLDSEGNIIHDGEVDTYAYEQMKHQAWEQLLSLKSEQSIDLTPHIMVGPVTESICELSSKINAQLILMGTKGEFSRRGVFRGIETQFVVRRSKVPVLTITAAPKIEQLKRMVLASSFKAPLKQNLDTFLTLRNAFNADLWLLHVCKRKLSSSKETEIHERISAYASANQIKDYRPMILYGYPIVQGINFFTQQQFAGLLSIGTHGRPGWMKLFWPSISERIATGTFTPVFTFHLQ